MDRMKRHGILNPSAGCRTLLACVAVLLLGGCQSGMDETADRTPADKDTDTPVTVYFSTLEAQVSRAAGNSLPQALAKGTRFRVYVYTQGGEQAATAVYTVGDDNTTTSEANAIKLYRGTYDFYFISDNTTGIGQPAVTAGKNVTVSNGTDFICTTLEDVVVQSGSGSSSILIPVSTPFSHLCSQVSVAVKADKKQPQKITSLSVNSITMKNLSSDRTYILGATAWNPADKPTYTENPSTSQWSAFTANNTEDSDGTSYLYESAAPYLTLPTDSTTNLAFDVNLTIGYDKTVGGSTSSTEETKPYTVSLSKALLPGTKYRIEFSLTFFGDLAATDIALTVKAYDERELTTDEIGGDEE